MPDKNPKKKVIVKVLKKPETKMEGYVPKGITKDEISKINKTTAFNSKAMAVESRAKGDSISGANKAKVMGKDIIDQRRAGNASANTTRAKEGNPLVARGRATNTNPDKYHSGGYSALTSDSYSRTGPLEKEMPVIKNREIVFTKEKKDSKKN